MLLAAGAAFAQEELPPLPASMIANQTEIVGELTIDEIHFETGKTEVSAADSQRLKELGGQLKGLPIYVLLQAFTDAVGDESKNQRLSEARATSAAAAVSEGGFSANQLITIGYGKQFSKGLTEGEKAAERRVTFTVLRLKSRPEIARRVAEEIRQRGLKLVERAPPGEGQAADTTAPPTSAVLKPRPPGILVGLATGPNLVVSKLDSSKPRTGPTIGINVWRWSETTALRLDLASQNAAVRSSGSSGSLTRRFVGGGLDHIWWSEAYGGVASSASAGVAAYQFTPTSQGGPESAAGWKLNSPSLQTFFYGFGFHPKMRLGGFVGLGITADSLAISPALAFGASFAW